MIKQYLERFAQSVTRFDESPRAKTINVHRYHLERFEREFGNEFNVANAKEYVSKIMLSGLSASSINHALAALDGLIEYLSDMDQLSDEKKKSWSSFKTKSHRTWKRKDRHRKYLPHSAVSDLLQAVSAHAQKREQANRDLSILGLVLFGPCRGGEVLRLETTDVELVEPEDESIPAHWCFRFSRSITKDHEDKEVRLFVAQSRIGDIDIFDTFTNYYTWRLSIAPAGGLFVRTRAPLTAEAISAQNLWYAFRRYAQAAGIHATPHWLRHTFGEDTEGRIEQREMRAMYGHSSDQTTRVYTDHDNDERLIRAQLQAAQIISRTDTGKTATDLVPH